MQQKISPQNPKSSPGYFRDIQNRLKKFVESGQLGPFKNGYWRNPAYLLPPEADLMAVTHYLEALDFQRDIMKIRTIFGGKDPHPNWLVGGVPCAINIDGDGAVGALNMERLNLVRSIIDGRSNSSIKFTSPISRHRVLLQRLAYGGGLSSKERAVLRRHTGQGQRLLGANLLMPHGAIINGDLKRGA